MSTSVSPRQRSEGRGVMYLFIKIIIKKRKLMSAVEKKNNQKTIFYKNQIPSGTN